MMQKPHLRALGGKWYCRGYDVLGWGKTMLDAFADYLLQAEKAEKRVLNRLDWNRYARSGPKRDQNHRKVM